MQGLRRAGVLDMLSWMDRLLTLSGELARRGFSDPGAAEAGLNAWGEQSDWPPAPDLDFFQLSGDPDQALSAMERIVDRDPCLIGEVLADRGWSNRALAVLGGSQALASHLVLCPEDLRLLADNPERRDGGWWRDFIMKRTFEAANPVDGIRLANRAGLVLLAGEDLSCGEPESILSQIARELSHLADAVLETALAIARTKVLGHERVRLAVIALGKAGAQELNYSSDVDVLFVAEPSDGETSIDLAMAVATRLASAMTRVCSDHTRTGTIWPLDAGLRPEGKAGQLVRTISSMRTYYTKWAKNWEFQAMLKARPAAGDLSLGQEFVDLVQPLVWQSGERDNFVAEAQAMRRRVVSLIDAREADREIKLGAGGLRDTEFSVQLLQLVHGRGDERIRDRGTLPALDSLIQCGYVGRADGAQLAGAYRFQRVLEHRIQLLKLRRTHTLPESEADQRRIARSLGIRTNQELLDQWRASTRRVLHHHQRIFYSPLLEAVSRIASDELRLGTDGARARLRSLGFSDPAQALRHIESLTSGASRKVEIQRHLLPVMLSWFADGPNPDFGLLAFRQISERLGDSPWYLRAMRDEGGMARRLALISSRSRYIVDLIMRSPETVQWLADDSELIARDSQTLRKNMLAAANRQDDPEKAFESVRSQRRRELCRLALADVLGRINLDELGRGLSDLATATIDAALAVASRESEIPPIGVISMGRWSGSELGYASDADVLFVVDDDTDEPARRAAAIAVRRMTDLLHKPGPEPALDLDADLRPEGKGGPLVRSVGSYLSYYQRWAATWERQALLRARPGAGALELCQRLLDQVDDFRYPNELTSHQVTEIRKLKLRMQAERIPRGSQPARNLKLGPGGLSDVEWTVQLLQLRHAHIWTELRTPNTLSAIAAASELNLIEPGEAAALVKAWRRASRLRNLIMLARGRASDTLPTDAIDLATIGSLDGYANSQASQLFEDWCRTARQATSVVDRYFWGK